MYDVNLLAKTILNLQKERECVIIAIDGKCGSGKTTLAATLADKLDCNVFALDEFYLSEKQRNKMQKLSGFANADIARFLQEVLSKLHSGQPFYYKRFDCKSGNYVNVYVGVPKKLNIVEGSFCMDKMLLPYYDYKIFLKAEVETRKQRLMERGSDINEFLSKWMPIEDAFFEVNNIESKADLLIET